MRTGRSGVVDTDCVRLLGGFEVSAGGRVIELSSDAQRLVAFLALQHRRLPRPYVAGTLWIDGSQERANGNLRSALWRLRRHADDLVDADTTTLAITPTTRIDTVIVTDVATRLCSDDDCPDPDDYQLTPFTQELLPGWYDDWVLIERERLLQQSLHTLEAIATRLTHAGRHAAAIQATLAAIALDPLRESAHRCLIRIHLDEGNHSEALRHYHTYRTHLHTQLGLTPSPHMERLVG